MIEKIDLQVTENNLAEAEKELAKIVTSSLDGKLLWIKTGIVYALYHPTTGLPISTVTGADRVSALKTIIRNWNDFVEKEAEPTGDKWIAFIENN